MSVPATMPVAAATVTMTPSVAIMAGRSTAVKGSPPTVDRLAAAVVADHHPLTGDTATAASAAGVTGGASAASAVSSLGSGRRHDRKASSQCEESNQKRSDALRAYWARRREERDLKD